MALYHHVPTKAALLDDMVERVLELGRGRLRPGPGPAVAGRGPPGWFAEAVQTGAGLDFAARFQRTVDLLVDGSPRKLTEPRYQMSAH